MSPEQWVALATGLTALLGAVGVIVRTRHDSRRGVAADEREARKDERADWATFAAQIQKALEDERRDSQALRAALDAKDRRLDDMAERLRLAEEHNARLERHIWRGLGPPPPQRPTMS